MRLTRALPLAIGGVLAMTLGGWTLVVAASPISTRPWIMLIVVISVAITVVQVWRERRTVHIATQAAGLGQAQPFDAYVVPYSLPPSAPLVGRDQELDEILRFVRGPRTDGPRIVLIHGSPGIGKTALAVNAARELAADFADGTLYATLGGKADRSTTDDIVEAVLGEFIDALRGANESAPEGLDERRELFRELTRRSDRRVLVVLDDVPSVDAVTSLLPAGSGCAVLVSSRDLLDVANAHRQELRPLDEKDATHLLAEIVGQDRIGREEKAARVIVQRTGGTPLALQLAAASLASRPHWTLQAAVKSMRQLKHAAGDGPFGRTLDLSYALLTEEEREALLLLGLLDSLIVAPWKIAALLDEEDERRAWRLCERLVDARLLEHVTDDSTGVAAFRLLEHVRAYARAQLQQRPLDEERVAAALRRLDEQLAVRGERDLRAVLRQQVFLKLERGQLSRALNHARGALGQARDNVARIRAGLEKSRSAGLATTGGGWRTAAEHLAEARESEGLALAALAEVLAELGVDDAMEMVTHALATESKSAAPRALRCQGRLLRRGRRLDEAVTVLSDALARATTIGDVPEQGRILRELAVVHASQGETDPGLAVVERALNLDLHADAASRLRASLLWARAVVLLEAAERADAEELFLQADHALREAAETAAAHGQRLWRAWIGCEWARALRGLGRFEVGRVLAFKAVDEFTQMRHRYATARCRLEIGSSYLAQRRPQEALPVLEEARQTFAICRDRWIEAEAAVALARAQQQVRKVGEAAQELRLAFSYYHELGDLQRLTTTAVLINELQRSLRDAEPAASDGQRPPSGGFWAAPQQAGADRS